jgi:endonuclease III
MRRNPGGSPVSVESEKTRQKAAADLLDVLDRLEAFYGRLPEPPSEAYPHFLWQVLSLNAPPQARDAAFLALRRIPALTPDAVWKAAPARVEAALLLAGPHSPERRRLLAAGTEVFRRRRDIDRLLGGPAIAARRVLRWLGPLNPHVAHWLLLFAGDHPILPLDPRICRVGWRLGWGEASEQTRLWQRKTRQALSRSAGDDVATLRRAATRLAHHAAAACSETAPRCGICPLGGRCLRRADGT